MVEVVVRVGGNKWNKKLTSELSVEILWGLCKDGRVHQPNSISRLNTYNIIEITAATLPYKGLVKTQTYNGKTL